ncbi:UDP-N-acetylmuramoyl-tripeptide--D-alanyl-D-alanine ligase [Bacteroidia bacterium]|nr:UDP-N-acetylmuramoyl-tripeptide--D-alanyl-D-alanine ligase [Bacteroidia bacterium]
MIIERLYDIFLQCGGVVSTDTRTIAPGSLFFALRGERFDANAFAASALEAGAAFAVVDNPALAGVEADVTDDTLAYAVPAPDVAAVPTSQNDPDTGLRGRFVVVPDVLEALQQLARHHRQTLGVPLLAITGSNGKTTTKELVARVLACKFAVSVTRGNLNNHIGVPLTLLAMTAETQLGIVEMGASARGEIALLCRIAMPNYGLITNIGRAHLEGFLSPEGVRAGKGELFDCLQSTLGTAFYCECNETVAGMVRERRELPSVLYPCYELAQPQQGLIAVKYHGETLPTRLVGDYNRYNVSAAIAIGEYFGVPRGEIAAAIASYNPDNHRSQRIDTGRNTLIADCYNANPSSMMAALENFAAEPSPLPRMVILGDMLELGEYSATEHRRIVDMTLEAGFGRVFLVGEHFCRVLGAGSVGSVGGASVGPVRCFATLDALREELRAHPLTGHLILLKSSRGIGLENAIAEL